MALLSYIEKEEATGKISEVYKNLEDRVDFIPNVVKLHTASPELFGKFMDFTNHYIDHPTFDPVFVAYIRALISKKESCNYCVKLQSLILKSYQVSDKDLQQAFKDYNQINIDRKRKELIRFVMDEMFYSLDYKHARINHLKRLGWTEKDIYEATMLGAIQKGMVKVINTFEVEPDF